VDRELAILATAGLATVGAAIATSEWLANRRHYSSAGLLARRPPAGSVSARLGILLDYPNIVAVLALRLAALAALPAALLSGRFAAAVLAVIFATTLLQNLRGEDALDGSDQMSTQVFGALFLGHLGGTPLALDAALGYLALQSCLSYAVAGLAKIGSPAWRDGSAVVAVAGNRAYGHPAAARWLAARPRLARLFAWGAMLGELAFPLALLGPPWAFPFLAWGVVFHLLNARLMGLNTFFWSFVSTYPAIVYCALMLRG
jgi:hypothetical protein